MREILTVTLNPTLDVSASTPLVAPHLKLRCADERLDPGGGGINVSRAVARLGGASTAFAALAGVTGDLAAAMLEGEGIGVARFAGPGLTRQSFAVTEAQSGQQYRFVMAGPQWSEGDVAAMLDALGQAISADAMVVLSGSLPPGVAPEVQGRIGALARAQGGRFLLDTSGPALSAAAAGMPGGPVDVLRMDRAEAEELAGRSFDTPEALALFGRVLLRAGVADHLVMALGAEGNVGVWAEGAVHCRPPVVKVVSAVGAGDSLMGALTLALAQGESLADAVRLGTAAAAAAVTTPATELFDGATARRLAAEVTVTPLDLPPL
ncbi:1-phosphofructokinase family hexose kinase [Pontivivens ytuae]|uniref:Phosphofructokinase n=1 Tax=Pontivivens ytuae TaxID=2789856 RepID=A0A7S9LRP1_9RHOB|nr:1-phosphofructokinase family hexose kinase [Pontivivens ytuae]QPH54047.1 1-phosphofructokinase family hexose kinase [Pontivivens ytuae]